MFPLSLAAGYKHSPWSGLLDDYGMGVDRQLLPAQAVRGEGLTSAVQGDDDLTDTGSWDRNRDPTLLAEN
jgi:hypothetical protein